MRSGSWRPARGTGVAHDPRQTRNGFVRRCLPVRRVARDGDRVIALTMGSVIMPEKRLLVCDDEAAVGRFVQNVAAPLGYDVRVTTSGEGLIKIYDDFRPTIILL